MIHACLLGSHTAQGQGQGQGPCLACGGVEKEEDDDDVVVVVVVVVVVTVALKGLCMATCTQKRSLASG